MRPLTVRNPFGKNEIVKDQIHVAAQNKVRNALGENPQKGNIERPVKGMKGMKLTSSKEY
ncbi:hypothetical protein JHK82_047081 [Glycine max]|nr:hypothetical protein JHK86_046972 [Glycine max]KHN18540.1 hypothetical protein glysoja_006953 [Glycine soja]KAG4942897.1 hypothetical protein JHK85_047543 [Glycine max]KAG5097227.1 hypothetical protein JHK82_047081 [Glycine max]KAG5102013.1 hypothetical protein JHK84_046982 [Glycine max]